MATSTIGYEIPVKFRHGDAGHVETWMLLNTVVRAGMLLGSTSSGRACPATTSIPFIGFCIGTVNNCDGTSGNKYVQVASGVNGALIDGVNFTSNASKTPSLLLKDGGLATYVYNSSMVALASIDSSQRVGNIVPPGDMQQLSASTWSTVSLRFKPTGDYTANKT